MLCDRRAVLIHSCDSIEYNKKKDKKASIKFVSDPSSRTDDTYKSGTVNVGPGEPATSGESFGSSPISLLTRSA